MIHISIGKKLFSLTNPETHVVGVSMIGVVIPRFAKFTESSHHVKIISHLQN